MWYILCMPILSPAEFEQAQAIACLAYCNPFLPERIQAEARVLGADLSDSRTVWDVSSGSDVPHPNLAKLLTAAEALAVSARTHLLEGVRAPVPELRLYEDVVMYVLYNRRQPDLRRMMKQALAGERLTGMGSAYQALLDDFNYFFHDLEAVKLPLPEPSHLMACFWQIQRAFNQIFHSIVGASMEAARLRASIWQSIFTHDMRRYRRTLYDKTGDFTTLVVGPSGTGKELVARAIALSQYIPFDVKKRAFAEDFAGGFFPLNLSALSPMLVESELFGHRRGAYTGAIEDRPGWLQTCPRYGTVFLDEIGELDPQIQVKLLRVLQTRTFQRLGDTRTLEFRGKIVAATNRDLPSQIRDGHFRRDLYYRLCSDIILTPSLRQQINDSPGELRTLVLFIARRLFEPEAESLTNEVMANIRLHLGADYPWAGNFRELEQCVRNVLIRGEYRPSAELSDTSRSLNEAMAAGKLSADELLTQYCRHVYRLTGSYEGAARRLGLDRRTVKAKVS